MSDAGMTILAIVVVLVAMGVVGFLRDLIAGVIEGVLELLFEGLEALYRRFKDGRRERAARPTAGPPAAPIRPAPGHAPTAPTAVRHEAPPTVSRPLGAPSASRPLAPPPAGAQPLMPRAAPPAGPPAPGRPPGFDSDPDDFEVILRR